jgi:hypothetical protein
VGRSAKLTRMSPAESIVPEAFTGLGTLKLPFAATVTGMGPVRTSMSESVWPHCGATAVSQMVNLQLPAYCDAAGVGVWVGIGVAEGAVEPVSVDPVGSDEPQLETARARHTFDVMARSLVQRFLCRDGGFGAV